MKHTVQNVSSRLISFRCNSGEFCHLAPKVAVELPDWEIDKNEMVEKLRARGLLERREPEKKKPKGKKEEPATPKPSDESPKKKKATKKSSAGRA